MAMKLPPYDEQLLEFRDRITPAILTDADLAQWRAVELSFDTIAPEIARFGLRTEELTVNGPTGPIEVAIIRPDTDDILPAVFNIHGGGMILANRFGSFIGPALQWIAEHRVAMLSPEYRLAPETRAPGGARDCYAALVEVVARAQALRIDPERIILAGTSGGGGLAAAVGLIARDEGGPRLLGQLLLIPQLDDRQDSTSARQFSLENGAVDPWPRESNAYAWNGLLGEGHEDGDVSAYQSPGRADDLSGLPPTFIDVGSNEVFRDPAVAFASRLWAAGVAAELHVWPGGFHGFANIVPEAEISVAATRASSEWLGRILARAKASATPI